MSLILTSSQTNDAKILYLTDASTWGSDSIPELADVVSASLTISYKTTSLDDYTDDVVVDITSIFEDAAGDSSLLIFPLVISDGTITTGDTGVDVFEDGVYDITYTVSDSTTDYSLVADNYLDKNIKTAIYSELDQVNTKYLCANNYYTKPIDDILLEKSLYDSTISMAYLAKKEELLNVLELLQRLTQ